MYPVVGAVSECLFGRSVAAPREFQGSVRPARYRVPFEPSLLPVQGQAGALITSDHHYGAIIDRDFGFVKFLNYLGDNGMNLTRIYPGGYFETPSCRHRRTATIAQIASITPKGHAPWRKPYADPSKQDPANAKINHELRFSRA
jgi:hypothetical protein